jgi:hypothetical protein
MFHKGSLEFRKDIYGIDLVYIVFETGGSDWDYLEGDV